ncbi:MAG: sigma-70 family RNA polymerase sigma factor [Ignavibacteriales bacterium]|nr:MAG: sigma-70 family RNA polymerase sigma factor [Ignavibacteriales bacterium]
MKKDFTINMNKTGNKNMETDLIDACLKGNMNSFSFLVKSYKKPLFTYLFRLCGNKDYAEDMLQETLLKVWQNLKKYNEQNKFSSWLFSIAHNVAVDTLRKRKVRNNIIYMDEIHEPDNNLNPFTILIAKESGAKISNAINKLPEKQKQVFLLRQHGEMTFKEIAELLKEPINTVLGHMHYAVDKLRKELTEKDE